MAYRSAQKRLLHNGPVTPTATQPMQGARPFEIGLICCSGR